MSEAERLEYERKLDKLKDERRKEMDARWTHIHEKLDTILLESRASNTKMMVIEEEVKGLNEILTGNGEPSKGLIVRVDRVEQRHENTRWWIIALGTLGSGWEALKYFFGGKH